MPKVAQLVRMFRLPRKGEPKRWSGNGRYGVLHYYDNSFQVKKPCMIAHAGMWYGKNPCDPESFGKVLRRPAFVVGKVGPRCSPWLKRRLC